MNRAGAPTFQLGIDFWSFHNSLEAHQMTIFDYFAVIHSYGFTCAQYNPLKEIYSGCGWKYIDDQKKYLEDHHLVPVIIDFRSLISPHLTDADLDPLKERLESAACLSAQLVSGVLTETSHQDMRSFGGNRPAMIDCAIENLGRVGELARQWNLKYLIENHGDFTAAEFALIMSRVQSPSIGMTFDTGNQVEVFEDPYLAAQTIAPLSEVVHYKNYGFEITHFGGLLFGTPLQDGLLDMTRINAIIRESSSGMVNVNIEVACQEASQELLFVESYVDFLRKEFLCR